VTSLQANFILPTIPFQEIILDKLDAQEEERKKAEARRQFLSQILSKRAVSNTAYDDQGKNPCDSDTRIDILAEIKKWVYDISDGAQSFLWLTGDPGSGKSAITASVARECNNADILWAQFFINRNIGNTTNPASYFPSIARQLADRSPDVATSVYGALKGQPSLMDDISERQAGKLFVDSLKVASSTDISKPVVVIIDGLG
jgi:DNA replication protein DnaC